jgi:hypothetical protein
VKWLIQISKDKSPGTDQILSQLTEAVVRLACYENHRIIQSVCNKAELPKQ